MTDTTLQPLHLTVVFMMIELVLLVLVSLGLRAMALGQEVIWECRWRWPHDLAAAYAKLRAVEVTRLATWRQFSQAGGTLLKARFEQLLAIPSTFSPTTTRDFIRHRTSATRGSRELC